VSLAGIVAEAEGGSEAQQRARARELADEIQTQFVSHWRGTCCRVVRHGLEFGTPECHANCQEVTAFTTAVAVEVLGRERQNHLRGMAAVTRGAAAVTMGAIAGLEIASLSGAAELYGLALWCIVVGLLGGALWAAAVVTRPEARRRLARPGRIVAAAVAAAAALLALLVVIAPQMAVAGGWLASLSGQPAFGTILSAFWVVVVAAFAVPTVRDLVRRKGSA
jgi:Zn-dependent protease